MDALICHSPGELGLVQRPDPVPEDGEVLVRTRRVGICGTDYHIFEGKHPFLEYPRVMGHELAVDVVELTEAARQSGLAVGETCVVNPYLACGHCIACRKGKPNCCTTLSVLGVHRDGGMAEYMSLPARNLLRAEGLSVDECATVEFLAVGAHAVSRGQVGPDDRALVVGAGPIGLGTALFAAIAGAKVTVMDRDPERLRVAEGIVGGTSITADEHVAQSIGSLTDGNGFDVVLDATGNQKSMEAGFDHVAHGGRYVLVSVVKDPITFADPDFHRKEMTLLGSRNALADDFERVIGAIRRKAVPVERLITHRTSLSAAVVNLPNWATQKDGLIKALVELWD